MRTLNELFRAMGASAETRTILRKFDMAPGVHEKASSVKELATSLGFDVDTASLPRGVAGKTIRDAFSRNGFQIIVSNKISVRARRWAVLHEMGHYYRHVDHSDPFSQAEFPDRSGDYLYFDEAKEREANQFAEVVLFGDNALEGAIGIFGHDCCLLGRFFGVSEDAVRIGMRSLCGAPAAGARGRRG